MRKCQRCDGPLTNAIDTHCWHCSWAAYREQRSAEAPPRRPEAMSGKVNLGAVALSVETRPERSETHGRTIRLASRRLAAFMTMTARLMREEIN